MDEPNTLEKANRMTGGAAAEDETPGMTSDPDGVPDPPGSGADESGLASGGLEMEDGSPT